MERIRLQIGDMTCTACAEKVRKALSSVHGVQDVKVSYAKSEAVVRFNPARCSARKLAKAVEKAGYRVLENGQAAQPFDAEKAKFAAGVLITLLAAYLILRPLGIFQVFDMFPQAEAGMGYGMLFLVGILTSVHCVAMCGGINLSQSIGESGKSEEKGIQNLKPTLLYNMGRVIGYTVVGAVVGALGTVLSFSGMLSGVVQIVAGLFMVIMGLNMLNLFPGLRRFMPRLPAFITRRVSAGSRGRGPLVVGLLNALMPCGPLQAMQLYALSTESPLRGAASMLVFALGTVPLMLGLGVASSWMSKKFAGRMVTAGAVVVAMLGVGMFGNGLSLSGIGISAETAQPAAIDAGVQTIQSELQARGYPTIEVAAGVPVQWNLHAGEGTLTTCNYMLSIPAYELTPTLQVGDNMIEFVPEETGTFIYSCWMGMIRGAIHVV